MLERIRDLYSDLRSKLEDVERWIAYRTYERYTIVDSGLEPGYYDPSEILLHVNFNILKDFVEVDLAIQQATWSVYTFGLNFRSRELGLKYIKEIVEQVDEDPNSTEAYKISNREFYGEIEDLYLWWENYPNRPDADTVTGLKEYRNFLAVKYGNTHGWNKLNNGMSQLYFKGTPAEEDRYRELLDLTFKEEERQEQEVENRLIRLIKIRRALWT